MSTAATTGLAAAAVPADARSEPETVHLSRLWPHLMAAWARRLDRRIEDDLRWLDHPGALEDFRSASRG
jgi:hypothetical protein